MKIIIPILFVCSTVFAGLPHAENVDPLAIWRKKISIDFNDAPLYQALANVCGQIGYQGKFHINCNSTRIYLTSNNISGHEALKMLSALASADLAITQDLISLEEKGLETFQKQGAFSLVESKSFRGAYAHKKFFIRTEKVKKDGEYIDNISAFALGEGNIYYVGTERGYLGMVENDQLTRWVFLGKKVMQIGKLKKDQITVFLQGGSIRLFSVPNLKQTRQISPSVQYVKGHTISEGKEIVLCSIKSDKVYKFNLLDESVTPVTVDSKLSLEEKYQLAFNKHSRIFTRKALLESIGIPAYMIGYSGHYFARHNAFMIVDEKKVYSILRQEKDQKNSMVVGQINALLRNSDISDDGNFAAFGTSDNKIKIVDLRNPKKVVPATLPTRGGLHFGFIWIGFSRSVKKIIGVSRGEIMFWDFDSFRKKHLELKSS